MSKPLALAFDPTWRSLLSNELDRITRAFILPESGKKLWASFTQGKGPWNAFITNTANEIMTYQPIGAERFIMTHSAIINRDYDGPKGHWIPDLRTLAVDIRSTLLKRSIIAMTDHPLLILMMERETVVAANAFYGVPPIGLYVPSPELSGHEILAAQERLDRLFEGRFVIEAARARSD